MLKVNELFSGIGAFRKALINLGVEHEVVGIAEIDKYAIKSYEAMYGQVHNYGDISKSLKLDYADMWTYGFPCQDISVAGKQAGIERHTRSGLLYQVQRLLEVAYQYDELPKYLILENVKNLVGKKFRVDFDEWLNYLNELGYNNYWKVLNAKNYGVPQNRERVFVVSIRKDIDTGYEFPMPFDNGIRLKDVLEDEVDEKFYISNEKVEKLISSLHKGKGMSAFDEPSGLYLHDSLRFSKDALLGESRCLKAEKHDSAVCIPCITPDRVEKRQNGRRFKEDGDPSFTLTSQDRHGVLQTDKPVRIGNIYGEDRGTGFAGNVWEKDAISPTLTTMQGGNREPMVMLETSCNQAVIQRIDIPQTVSVRKYVVDTDKLVNVLRSHKHLSNKDIAEKLNKPITLVEHWFRADSCFAIPDADVWMELKDLLNIKTDEFDQCIMEFEEREGVYEKANRCYHEDGIAPTLTSTSADEKIITSCNQAVLRPVRTEYGKAIRKAYELGEVEESRHNMTQLEPREDGISNTLTTVQKDNLLLDSYGIRKLTPKECWRLMGFSDSDFQKCVDVGISNSQLYKQAGNSIVVDVLFYMLENLLNGGNQ